MAGNFFHPPHPIPHTDYLIDFINPASHLLGKWTFLRTVHTRLKNILLTLACPAHYLVRGQRAHGRHVCVVPSLTGELSTQTAWTRSRLTVSRGWLHHADGRASTSGFTASLLVLRVTSPRIKNFPNFASNGSNHREVACWFAVAVWS